MTERLKNTVSIPSWLIALAVPVAVTIMGFALNASTRAGQIEEKVNSCKVILDNKVDKSEYNADIKNIKESLQRIEDKLDKHIEK